MVSPGHGLHNHSMTIFKAHVIDVLVRAGSQPERGESYGLDAAGWFAQLRQSDVILEGLAGVL